MLRPVIAEVEVVDAYVEGRVRAKSGSVSLWPYNSSLSYVSDADAGYVAGLIDGEGTIGLSAHKKDGSDGTRRSHSFSVRVSIANTSQEMLEEVRLILGFGRVYKCSPPEGTRKQAYKWMAAVSEVRPLLERVAPLLRLKRDQALLVLVYLDMQDSGRHTASHGLPLDLVSHATNIYHRLRELNRKGMSVEEEIEFGLREPKQRETICAEPECGCRRYHKWRWCHKHWMQYRDPVEKPCERCGVTFDTRNERKRFCSDRCQQSHAYDVRRGSERERHREITEEMVKQAISLLATGDYNQTDVAKIVGADRTALGEILRGRSRKEYDIELPDPEVLARGYALWRERRLKTGEGLKDAACVVCGKAFKAVHARNTFCSKECHTKDLNRRQNERYHRNKHT